MVRPPSSFGRRRRHPRPAASSRLLTTRLATQPDRWSGRTRPARAPGRALGGLIAHITSPTYKKFGFAEPHILAHWPDIVGAALADYAAPVKLSFPARDRRGGTLTLEVNGPAAVEIQHLEPQILQRINSYYGFTAVARLAIRRAPASRPARHTPPATPPRKTLSPDEIAPLLADISSDPLEAALRRLGETLSREEQSSKP